MAKSTIGEFLSVQRKAKGMTQEEIAEKLGVSAKTVSSWENDRTCPDILLLPAIANLYGVSVDELVRGERNSNEDGGAQAQSINEEAIKKMRKNKLARYRQTQGIWTSVAAVGACFVALGLLIASVWALVLAILGTCAFFVGIAFLWYQNKKYLSSEGIAFADDITTENAQFYLSVMHKLILRMILCILPIALGALVPLLNFSIGTAISVLAFCLFCIPVCAIVALLLWQFCLISRYGTEEQKFAKKSNVKRYAVTTAAFALVVVVVGFLLSNVFFGLSHDYVKKPTEETYATKEEFIEHLETLCVYDRILSSDKKTLIAPLSTFTLNLDEAKEDIKALREQVKSTGEDVARHYDVGNGFWLGYENNSYNGEFICVSYVIGEEEKFLQNAKVVTLHNEDGTTDLVLDLFHRYYIQNKDRGTIGIGEYPDNDYYTYYYTDDFAFLSKYEADVYECRNGEYGIYIHTIYMVHENQMCATTIALALVLDIALCFVLRKKYGFIPVQKTL